jgi:hypothetical protein
VNGAFELGVHHTLRGNHNRFQTGRVAIHLDDEWRTAIPAGVRRAVLWRSLALMCAYRYVGPFAREPRRGA